MEEQISVSQVFSANLLPFVEEKAAVAPVTSKTGGNSSSNPNAGLESSKKDGPKPITTGDKAGAGILTLVLAGFWAALMAFAMMGSGA